MTHREGCTLASCLHCRRLRVAADCMPADTSFPAWVVMRGLVEEMQTAADPSVALGMLGDLTATGMPAHVALASTPGAVTALLDVLKSDDDGSNAEIARSLLAACVHADPAMCGPAVLGNDVAKPIVGLFIAWLEDEELEPYANAFCVALLAISESRAWITSSCAQTNGGRPSIEESEDDDDDFDFGDFAESTETVSLEQSAKEEVDDDDDDDFGEFAASVTTVPDSQQETI